MNQKEKKERKNLVVRKKMDRQVKYVCDDNLSNDQSEIKVWWKSYQRSATCQLLQHYGGVICCNIFVRL